MEPLRALQCDLRAPMQKSRWCVCLVLEQGLGVGATASKMVEKLDFAYHPNGHMIKFISASVDKILLWVE